MNKFKIDVTQKLIDESDGQSADNCMVYNAIKLVVPSVVSVGVVEAYFALDDDTTVGYAAILPMDVQNKVSDHYEGIDPEPFSFDIEVPEYLCV